MSGLVILDRDGVINEDSDHYIRSADQWQPIAGSIQAIARLTQAGYKVAIATNQSGLARGYFSQADLDAIHSKMQHHIAHAGGRIDALCYCPHGPNDGCDCRKPKPGLLQQISEKTQHALTHSPMIGDSMSDLQAAMAAGCLPILVLTGKGTTTQKNLPTTMRIPVYANLAAWVDHWLR